MDASATPPTELRTPAEWERDPRVTRVVHDPDGWRFKHGEHGPQGWDVPISFQEYQARAASSTTKPRD
ncbi:MAG TPA: hypothetical protein VLF67_03195 [Candidatus Saccharimonas sp.]|nr:hypothetical protein [Candidatus Saccharimonas sp.]